MVEKTFWHDKRDPPDQKLHSRLENWKLQADTFYRASEYIFIADARDMHNLSIESPKFNRGEKKTMKYIPILHDPYFILIGYSLENMIKGIMLYENPSFTAGRKLDKIVANHKLVPLIKKIKIELSTEEEDLLEFLTAAIEWNSKYPVPRNAEDMIGSSNYSMGKAHILFLSIYRKLSMYMENNCTLAKDLHGYFFTNDPMGS